MKWRLRLAVVGLTAAAVSAACRGATDASIYGADPWAGSFTLATVNGQAAAGSLQIVSNGEIRITLPAGGFVDSSYRTGEMYSVGEWGELGYPMSERPGIATLYGPGWPNGPATTVGLMAFAKSPASGFDSLWVCQQSQSDNVPCLRYDGTSDFHYTFMPAK